MISSAPNGFIIENLIQFTAATKNNEWRVAGGFQLYPPVLTGGSNRTKNDYHESIEGMLTALGAGTRCKYSGMSMRITRQR